MKICVLTYDVPHLKTAQLIVGLRNRGLKNIDLLLTPFSNRSKREVVFEHRPNQFVGPSPQALAKYIDGVVYDYQRWPNMVEQYDFFLVCGSNLIEPAFSNTGKILNVHAGLIPVVRGLDSFKWAILNMLPLGNTLHRIDETADAGEVLAHRNTPVFSTDSLEMLAQRHYDNEIWMLRNFDLLLAEKRPEMRDVRDPTRRMSMEIEHRMMDKFPEYRAKFAIDRSL